MGDAEILSRSEWVEIVQRRTGSVFDIVNVKTKRLTTTGGFLGEHYLSEVTVRSGKTNDPENVLNFFVKIKPNSSGQLEIVRETSSFEKEIEALSKIFVEFRSLLEDNGRDMEWMGKVFYMRPGLIVMEDLSVQNFRVFGLRDLLGYQHFAMTVKIVANLHSASLIYEEKHPCRPFRIDSVYKEYLKEAFFRHDPDRPTHPGTKWLEASVKGVWLLVELIRGKGALLRMKTEIETAMNFMYELLKTSTRYRNVLCHGDLKRDNILFRYEKEQPVEAVLVDFQLIRYAPPANDLMSLLYLSTNRSFRAHYEEQLLALYYEQLAANLKRYDLEPEKVLPWDEFTESCRYYKSLGVMISSCYNAGTLLKEEDISHIFKSPEDFSRFLKVDRSPEIIHGFKTDPFYRERITEVIEEFIEECIDKKSYKTFGKIIQQNK